MTPKIKQLAEKANLHVFINRDGSLPPELAKFAELIVRACADAGDDVRACDCDYVGDGIVELMGYGVEEGSVEWRAKQ